MKYFNIRWVPLAILAVIVITYASPACGVVIHVDGANVADPGKDGSPAHPWGTLTNAVADLALKNGVSQGGHILAIASGVYTGTVNLSASHSGLLNSTNAFMATNAVLDAAGNVGFYFNNADYIRLQGLSIRGASQAVYLNGGSGDNSFVRCCIYSNTTGIFVYSDSWRVLIDHCNIVANSGGPGVDQAAGRATVTVRNSVLAANQIGVREKLAAYETILENNLFHANAVNLIEEENDECQTADQINSYAENSGNLVASPGFSDLANDWNFNEFYVGSPCYGAGTDGLDVGALQSAPTVPVSSNTYYVASSGNDGMTKAEAQNQASPWATITKAASEAVAGDTIVVGPGSYGEDVTITNSGYGAQQIIFRADGAVSNSATGTGFLLDRVCGIHIEGFSIPLASNGISMLSSWNNTVTDVSVNATNGIYLANAARNTVSHGMFGALSYHGAFLSAASGNVFSDCIFSNCLYGMRIMDRAQNNAVDRCQFIFNRSIGVYVDGYVCGTSIENSNICSNSNDGIKLDWGTSVSIVNCDVVDNGADGLDAANAGVRPVNTIFADNGLYGSRESHASCEILVTNCCYHANSSGEYYDNDTASSIDTEAGINALSGCTGNIVADPDFRNRFADDYRLNGGSPCMDAGTPTSDFTIDLYGNRRVEGAACDIGSFEMPAAGSVFCLW